MGRDGQPCNTLWISFPPSSHIDEQMIRNTLISFGQIKSVKTFSSRNLVCVEFTTVDDAQRAKEGLRLQGHVFNDPRIKPDVASVNENPFSPLKKLDGFGSRLQGHVFNDPRIKPDVASVNENPFSPLKKLDGFGSRLQGHIFNDPRIKPDVASVNENPFPPLKKLDGFGSNNHPIMAQASEPFISPPQFSDMDTLYSRMLPSTVKSTKHPTTSSIECFQRDSKRPKIGANLLNNNASFPLRNADHDHGLRKEPHHHIWHGIIAKGGTPVCHAQCVPYGKGLGIELPHVVDCTARTELDMLARHYDDAIGFEIVYFLPVPDSEDDLASYTEFLEYLKVNNRAGVAKFVDDINFFLVPPVFLTKILNVTAAEHIYGVVFKFPKVPSSTLMEKTTHLPASTSIGYMHRTPPSQAVCDLTPTKEKQSLPMDYNTKIPLKPPHPATTEPPSIHSLPPNHAPRNTLSAPQASVSFIP
ncbi:hypothetical protein PIB30_017769 [Stylosanthes scabra]|uniref:RRM domain-containing protein n=1 Tax=Stylosanthes scabra TaxID=79078 RepID=A0ABU6T9S9_9FABA|nr:hypothetical protein [Stylosanthes scabra]